MSEVLDLIRRLAGAEDQVFLKELDLRTQTMSREELLAFLPVLGMVAVKATNRMLALDPRKEGHRV
jgi:hypothetical protein